MWIICYEHVTNIFPHSYLYYLTFKHFLISLGNHVQHLMEETVADTTLVKEISFLHFFSIVKKGLNILSLVTISSHPLCSVFVYLLSSLYLTS